MDIPQPRLRSLTLTLTERCNLRCSYCCVPVERGRTMPMEVVDAAVDLLAEHAHGDEVTLSFYGGEPLLALDSVRRAVERARVVTDGKRRLRVLMPTNGLLLDASTLAYFAEAGIDLAISIDGDASAPERCFADGTPSTAELLPLVPNVLALQPRSRVLARMTVTPANVGNLSSSVRMLARLGFARILYMPAFEETWDDDAVAVWGREHRRIGTWALGAAGAGVVLPDLPGWRAIEERLVLGKRRSACGAGDRLAAVSTDGGLYPCYRLVLAGDDEGCRLGDVAHGFTNRAALERFAAFDPNDVEPEQGTCASCPSRDGCTHACPAFGWQALGDVRRVPAVACRLMCAQVEAVRPFAAMRRRPAGRSPQRRAAAVLVAAAALSGVATAASCGGGFVSQGAGAGGGDQTGGGVCPVSTDSGVVIDAGGGGQGAGGSGGGICDYGDAGGGGVCPVQVDGGQDTDGGGGGGICDFEDAGGGVCPVQVDGGDGLDGGGVDDAGGGGMCKFSDDSGGGGGICPQGPPDAGGGIC